ncbi:hypothetical protein [Brevundimonas sp.]|uniref:hypothetical protein n=1 Tax=Brevundimonas sp. TaxID=1871086 RepID=UPI003D6DA325
MFKNWLKKRAPHEAVSSAWPSLPTSGFMLGRAATAADIDLGDAVFSQATNDGLKVEPCPIAIPQYALWQDEDGSTHPVFVVQAEKHVSDPTGEPIYGLRTFDGEEIVASCEEVRLLGAVAPAT